MSYYTRRSLLATTGTALTGLFAGCSAFDSLSDESTVTHGQSALAALPGDLPWVPAAMPVQPKETHLVTARERIRSLLEDTEVSHIPNEVVRHTLTHEREAARGALSQEDDSEQTRVEALAGLTHPRSEAMFVHAGLAAFDGTLSAADIAQRRDRHHREAEAFLADHSYLGPPNDPVGALAEHARIIEWGHNGVRITKPNSHHEYENAVLHVAELAQDIEWGRAYAVDARRLYDHYLSTLKEQRDYEKHFSRAAQELVGDVEKYVDAPDWDALIGGFERDIENTPGANLLKELAESRWIGAQQAVEYHNDSREALAIMAAMRALTADHALAEVRTVVSEGGYDVPESVDPIAAERTAAVEGLQTLLETSPVALAHRLAHYVQNPIRNADLEIHNDIVSAPGRFLFAQYGVANRFATAAPAVLRRVGELLEV